MNKITGDDIPIIVGVEMLDGRITPVLLQDLGEFYRRNDRDIKSRTGIILNFDLEVK